MSEQERYYAEKNRQISDAKNAANEALVMKFMYAAGIIIAAIMLIYIALMAIISPGLFIVFASYKLFSTSPFFIYAALASSTIYLFLLIKVKFDFYKSVIWYGIACAITSSFLLITYYFGASFAIEMKSLFWNPPSFSSTSTVKNNTLIAQEPIAAVASQTSEQASNDVSVKSFQEVPENKPAPIMIPSFDCNKASNSTELTICSDPELSSIDTEMANIYKNISSTIEVQNDQRYWMKNVRNACDSDKLCVLNAYKSRIAQLR
jgi:uncharacterized protein YecT (DUF1311 family)